MQNIGYTGWQLATPCISLTPLLLGDGRERAV